MPNLVPLPGFELPEKKIVSDSAGLRARLAELNLELDYLQEAVNSGQNGASIASGAHPKTSAGTYRWGETVAALRSRLGGLGWSQRDEKNAPRIVSPDGKVSIMVATGNAKTGTKEIPSNATVKGLMTAQDVWNNSKPEQEVIAEVEEVITAQTPKTWVLLYFYSEKYNHIRVELSLPAGMTNGYIHDWEERIILPKIEFGDRDFLLDAQPDEVPEDIVFDIGNADTL